MPTTVNIHEAKTHLSRLLERVEGGERIVIARAGRPIADLVPHVERGVVFGLAKGRIGWEPETFDEFDDEVAALFGLSPDVG